MADFKLVGAVAIKVRPDATGFKEKTQIAITRELKGVEGDVKVKAKIDVNADTTEAKRDAEQAAAEISKKKVTMRVGLDHDSVRAAQQRFEKMLEPTKNIKFNIKDQGSIDKARAKLEKLARKAHVKMTYNEDEKGYQSVLDRIASIRRQKAEVPITFKTKKSELDRIEKQMRENIAKLGVVEVPVKARSSVKIGYDLNRASLEAAISEIEKELSKFHTEAIYVEFDKDSLEAEKAKLKEQLDRAPLEVKFTPDEAGYKDILNKIKTLQRQRAEITVDLNLSDQELKEKAEEIRRDLDALTRNPHEIEIELNRQDRNKVENDARGLKQYLDELKGTMHVDLAGTLPAAAQLAFLGRDRFVTYFAKVNARSLALVEGTLKSLAGLNVLRESTDMLEKLFTKFDTISLKISTITVLLGTLANMSVFALTSIASVGEGVLQSLGLLALGPTILGSLFTTLLIGQAVFKDFGAAAHGIEAAMKRLPPAGQAAARTFQKVFAEIRESISKKFWGEASDSMLRFAKTALPAFSRGLAGVAGKLGKIFGGILDSFTNLSAAGDLDKMFNNLVLMFHNAAGGATALWDALNIIGLRGSEFLPQFGTWLTKISQGFRDWADAASKSGDLTRWIQQGVVSLQEMWKVGWDVVDIFKAISNASTLAGSAGLGTFQMNLRRIADEMNSPVWQAKASNLFAGARAGASELNSGFKDLKHSIGQSSEEFGNMLRLMGSVGGGVLSLLGDLFGNENFQDGATAALQGLGTMMETLRPGMVSLANLIGNLQMIAGVAFSNMGNLLSRMLELVDKVFSKVADGLAAVTPRLMNTVGSLFLAATPLVIGLAEALKVVLDVLALVPNGFVLAGAAAFAFFGMRALASKFFDKLAMSSYFQNLRGEWANQQVAAGKTLQTFRTVNGELQKFTVPAGKFNATGAIFRDVTSQVGQTTGALRAMYQITSQVPGTLGPVRSALSTTGNAFVTMGTGIRMATTDFRAMYSVARAGTGALNPMSAALMATRSAFTRVSTEAQSTARHVRSTYGVFRNAPAQLTPFNSALRVAGEATQATAKVMGGGLLNLLGGPWGIAFLAAGLAVGAFAQKQQDAKAKVESFTATLDKQTGAITATTAAMVAANIVAQRNDGFYLANSGAKSASETMKKLKLSIEEVSDIVAKGGSDYENMIKILEEGKSAIDQANGSWEDGKGMIAGNGEALDAWSKKLGISKDAVSALDLEGLLFTFQRERGAIQGSVDGYNLRNDSLDKGVKRTQAFNEQMRLFNDTLATGDARTRALDAALKLLNGTPLDLEDAKAAVNDQIRSATGDWQEFSETVNGEVITSLKLVGGAFRDAKGNVRDFTNVINPTTGEIETVGEAGARLREILKPLAERVKGVATEMKTAKKPISEVATYLDQQREAFVKLGTDAGLSKDLVELAYDHMIGANPKELLTIISAQGIEEAEGKLRNYKVTLDEIDAYRAVAEIAGDDKVLGIKLADAYTNLSAFDKVIATATADLDPTQADAVRVRILADLFNLAQTNPTVRANMDPQLLNDVLADANRDLDNLNNQRPSPIVTAQTEEARRRIQQIKDLMATLTGKDIKIGVNTVYTSQGPQPTGYVARNGVPAVMANGGILNAAARQVKHFANGGIERHVAQITKPGGPIRVWSERETQGEAYVPYAMSKRPRSVAILSQVAKDFGYQLTRADQYANGGITGGASPSTHNTASVHIGTLHTTDPDAAVRKIRMSQMDALAVAGISLNGAV